MNEHLRSEPGFTPAPGLPGPEPGGVRGRACPGAQKKQAATPSLLAVIGKSRQTARAGRLAMFANRRHL